MKKDIAQLLFGILLVVFGCGAVSMGGDGQEVKILHPYSPEQGRPSVSGSGVMVLGLIFIGTGTLLIYQSGYFREK